MAAGKVMTGFSLPYVALYEANGTTVTILESSGSWRRVRAMNGVTGWVSGNYLVKTSVATAWVNTRPQGER